MATLLSPKLWQDSMSRRRRKRSAQRVFRRLNLSEFESIYRAHRGRVYYWFLRMVRNKSETEDLTQDAFLLMHRKLDTYRGESSFATWMHRLVLNVGLMRLRAKSRREVPLEEVVERLSHASLSLKRQLAVPDGQLAGAIDRLTVQKAIDQLPFGSKTAFCLRYLEGYSHREIYELTRCSVNNSKSKVHRVRCLLRDVLDQKWTIIWIAGEYYSVTLYPITGIHFQGAPSTQLARKYSSFQIS